MKELHIYYFLDMNDLKDEIIEKYIFMLPSSRRIKAEKYYFMKDKKQCLISYLILAYGIKKSFNLDVWGIDFSTLKYGKPYFKNYPSINFNISHCINGCVCAVDSCCVGVDIQNINPKCKSYNKIYDASLTTNEIQMIKKSNELENEIFTKFWTMKESYIKFIGAGFYTDIKTLDFSNVTNQTPKFGNTFIITKKIRENFISVCSVNKKKTRYINISVFELLTYLEDLRI